MTRKTCLTGGRPVEGVVEVVLVVVASCELAGPDEPEPPEELGVGLVTVIVAGPPEPPEPLSEATAGTVWAAGGRPPSRETKICGMVLAELPPAIDPTRAPKESVPITATAAARGALEKTS